MINYIPIKKEFQLLKPRKSSRTRGLKNMLLRYVGNKLNKENSLKYMKNKSKEQNKIQDYKSIKNRSIKAIIPINRTKFLTAILVIIILISISILSIAKVSALPETIISEVGLPQGYNWSLSLGNVTKYSVSPQIILIGNNSKLIKFSVPTLTNASKLLNCTTFYTPINSSGYITSDTHNNIIKFTNYTICRTTFIAVEKLSKINWTVEYNGVSPYENISNDYNFINRNSTYSNVLTFVTSPGNYSVDVYYKLKNSTMSLNPYIVGYTTCPILVNGTINKSGCYKIPSYKLEAGKTYDIPFYLNITFKETGLPLNTEWNISYNNKTIFSNFSNIKFLGVIGKTYNIKIYNAKAGNCIIHPYKSKLNLTVENNVNFVYFINESCVTKFIERGLPSGMNWKIVYGTYFVNSSSNIIQINSSSEIGQSSPFSFEGYDGIEYNGYLPNIIMKKSQAGVCAISYIPNITSDSIYPGSTVIINFENKTICNFPALGLLKTTLIEKGLSQSMLNSEALDMYIRFYWPASGSAMLQFASNGAIVIGAGNYTKYYSNNTDFYGKNITLYLSKGYYNFNLFGPILSYTKFPTNNSNLYTLEIPENKSINITAGSTVYLDYREASAWNLNPSPIQHTSNDGVLIPFNRFKITIFTEKGLPNGTNWTVDYNGVKKSSNSNQISFFDYNGSYNYSIPPAQLKGCGKTYYDPAYNPSGVLLAGSNELLKFNYTTPLCNATNETK